MDRFSFNYRVLVAGEVKALCKSLLEADAVWMAWYDAYILKPPDNAPKCGNISSEVFKDGEWQEISKKDIGEFLYDREETNE